MQFFFLGRLARIEIVFLISNICHTGRRCCCVFVTLPSAERCSVALPLSDFLPRVSRCQAARYSRLTVSLLGPQRALRRRTRVQRVIRAGLDGPHEGLKSKVRRIQHVIRAGLNEPQEGGRAYTV